MRLKKKIIVGMSGGVDSSVAAYLLKKQGHEVIGMFMKNWEEKDENGRCKSAIEYQDVIKVCEKLGIPYYPVNFVKEYREKVFNEFLEKLEKGDTPNPDVLCNKEIKFDTFLNYALEMDADFVATGHYCRTDMDQMGRLFKGVDQNKDQSYFLHAVDSEALKKVLFPIGELAKSKVREIAKEVELANYQKKDSTGICFIGEKNFRPFLSKYLQYNNGHFCQLNGEVVGEHYGHAYYTIGQRKGLGLGGPGRPWYVVKKDPEQNIVYVERGNHPQLYSIECEADDLHWIRPPVDLKKYSSNFPFLCKAKIRYRQVDQDCALWMINENKVHVEFKKPQRAITPAQSIVFYDEDECLGGGSIL